MSKRRNQKYIDREVQTNLLVRLSIHWMLFVIANFIAIFLWTLAFDTPSSDWGDVAKHALFKTIPFAIVSFALAPAFIWDAIKLSNRFAGPIVRVRRTLALIADGKFPKPIEFRSGDFWKSLAHDLNRAFLFKSSANSTSNSAPE